MPLWCVSRLGLSGTMFWFPGESPWDPWLFLWWDSIEFQHFSSTSSFTDAHLHCAPGPVQPHDTLWGHHSPDVYECNSLGSQQWEWSLQSFTAQQPCLPLLEKALETHLRLVWPRPGFNVLRFPTKPSTLVNWHDQVLLDQDSPGRPQLAAGITGNSARGSNLVHLPLPQIIKSQVS